MYDLDTDGMSTAVSLDISIMLATGTMLLTPEFLRLCVCAVVSFHQCNLPTALLCLL